MATQDHMNTELQELRRALWAAVEAQGGRISIPKATWESYSPQKRATLLIFDGTGTRILTTEQAKKAGAIV